MSFPLQKKEKKKKKEKKGKKKEKQTLARTRTNPLLSREQQKAFRSPKLQGQHLPKLLAFRHRSSGDESIVLFASRCIILAEIPERRNYSDYIPRLVASC